MATPSVAPARLTGEILPLTTRPGWMAFASRFVMAVAKFNVDAMGSSGLTVWPSSGSAVTQLVLMIVGPFGSHGAGWSVLGSVSTPSESHSVPAQQIFLVLEKDSVHLASEASTIFGHGNSLLTYRPTQ